MQTKILIGSPRAQNVYISSFVSQYKIHPYSIVNIENVAKIDDVHKIIRASRIYPGAHEKRLVIFSSPPTLPAQNALLKYLEELPTSDFVFFLVNSADELLATICSRCTIIVLDRTDSVQEIIDNQSIERLFLHDDIRNEIFLLAQTITTSLEYERFVKDLRQTIVQKIETGPNKIPHQQIKLLKYLHQQNQYVQENNVNPKLTVEAFDLL